MANIIVVVDGLPSCGKTSTAKELAEMLKRRFCPLHKGMTAINSGLFYRAVGKDANDHNIRVNDIPKLIESARGTCKRLVNLFEDEYAWEKYAETLNDEEIGTFASYVSPLYSIRQLIYQTLRGIAENTPCIVCDGQNSHEVFENAILFFLEAPLEMRALWRHKQTGGDLQEITQAIHDREHRDKTRGNSPLITPPEATIVTTSNFSSPKETALYLFKECLKRIK